MNLDREIEHVSARLTVVDAPARLREKVLQRLEPRRRRPVALMVPFAAAATLVAIGIATRPSPPSQTNSVGPRSPRTVASTERIAATPPAQPSRTSIARVDAGTTPTATVIEALPLPASAPPALELEDIQPRELEMTLLTIETVTTIPLRVDAIDVAQEIIEPLPRGIS